MSGRGPTTGRRSPPRPCKTTGRTSERLGSRLTMMPMRFVRARPLILHYLGKSNDGRIWMRERERADGAPEISLVDGEEKGVYCELPP